MNILMLSNTFPYPPTKGGTQIRTFYLLRHLQQQHRVTLVTQRSPEVSGAEIAGLRDCVDTLVLFDRPPEPSAGVLAKLQRLGDFCLQGTPPSVKAGYSTAMQAWVDAAVKTGKYDVITCEHSVNESYVRPDWSQPIRTVVDVHSSVYATCRNQLQTGTAEKPWRDRLNLLLLKRYERRYCQKFSQIVVTTPEDEAQLQRFVPDRPITTIPNGVDFALFPKRQQDPGGHRLIFVGTMDYIANIDTAKFLSLDILPALQARYPDTTLALVGARPTDAVLALGTHPGVKVTGQVSSMAEYLHQATVCVIPMRTGFGIKNKTLEAMAAGIPVVGSDRGLEGLEVDQPLRALRANRVEEYVAAIGRLFEEAALRQHLADAAHAYVTREFTWQRAGQRYEQVLSGYRSEA
jgi:glycosyltransferase involved in cell wall biosynthesis